MKVKELIKRLQLMNSEAEIMFTIFGGSGLADIEIESIDCQAQMIHLDVDWRTVNATTLGDKELLALIKELLRG